ncbi:glycosyltransferase family 4 protein [Streptomyces sp. NPDC052107]|uniref:glycosyltransferase family 4 protein n=1 Tax=Streptomyces sp. NPDC052107 TaxID=3155632 RepID=UPI00343345E7
MNETAHAQAGPSPGISMRFRVALVHSFYSSAQPSGENVAVLDQAQALRSAGHEVTVVTTHTDALQTEQWYAARAAIRVATGFGRSPLAALKRFEPDVVHVHNLFPNFGTHWLKKWPGAVVATLHNFRPACAAGTLFRDGKMCTECPGGDRWAGLRHACYRGARSATLPLAWAGRGGAQAHPLLRRAERLVIPSDRSRDLYLRFGVQAEKLAVVPNFTDLDDAGPLADSAVPSTAHRWVYVGRLSEEKGILPLLRSWPENEPLDVIGSGPLESACRAAAPKRVRLLGAFPRAQLMARLPRYTGLVFPSVWPEIGAPLVYQEALAAGVPVLALAGSVAADCVRRDGPGTVYGSNDELPLALSSARRHFPTLRHHCRRVHAEHYTARSWTVAIEDVYAQALKQAADGQPVAATDPA